MEDNVLDVHQKDSAMNTSLLDIDFKDNHDYDEEKFEPIEDLERVLDLDEIEDNSPILHMQESFLKPSEANKPKGLPGINLNIDIKGSIKSKDFHEEFMENYDEFSQSWRDQIDREKNKN